MPADTTKVAVDKLTEAQAKAELKRLAAEIGAHDKRYYQEDAPTVSDAAYDALRRRYDAIEARFPDLRTAGKPFPQGGRRPVRPLCQGAPRGAHALARQCVQRAGRSRFRRSYPPFSAAARGRDHRIHRRAQDRWPVDVVALRGRRARQGCDARGRQRRRGRHGQCADAQGCAASTQRQEHSRGGRNAWRNLHDQASLPGAEQAPGRGR